MSEKLQDFFGFRSFEEGQVTRCAALSHFEASKKPNLHLIHNESQHNGSRENAGDNRNRKFGSRDGRFDSHPGERTISDARTPIAWESLHARSPRPISR